MKLLAVHPGPLMYTKIYLRLEPLGLELVAQAARHAGHEVRILDLQVEQHSDFHRMVAEWQPDVIAFSCNYLANVPEVVDLAKAVKEGHRHCFILVGGHSASFVAADMLAHAEGAIDCIMRGEGEASIERLLSAIEHDPASVLLVPVARSCHLLCVLVEAGGPLCSTGSLRPSGIPSAEGQQHLFPAPVRATNRRSSGLRVWGENRPR